MKPKKRITLALALVLAGSLTCLYAENIDPCDDGSQYAWGENIGWLNFEPNRAEPNVGALVKDHTVTGFIWSENIGWIRLNPKFGGVTNDGTGRLSGYAWSENVGWIDFDPNVAGDPNHYGVTIDTQGNFDGWVWGENIGWLHLASLTPVAYKVQTSWPAGCWHPDECAGQPYGDATCDDAIGVIDFADLAAVKVSFFTSKGDPNYNCCADFDHDEKINFADLAILKRNFFTTGYIPSTGNQNCPP